MEIYDISNAEIAYKGASPAVDLTLGTKTHVLSVLLGLVQVRNVCLGWNSPSRPAGREQNRAKSKEAGQHFQI